MTTKPSARVYIDTNVLSVWVFLVVAPNKRRKLQPRGIRCQTLLDHIKGGKFSCKFQVSDWGLSELVQSFRDKAILPNFLLDGHEISAFNRVKSQYRVEKGRGAIIHRDVRKFEKFLHKYQIEIRKTDMDWHKIHEYCLKYSLETPDAVHVLSAIQGSSSYLVTTDGDFKKSKVAEIKVIDPGELVTQTHLFNKPF